MCDDLRVGCVCVACSLLYVFCLFPIPGIILFFILDLIGNKFTHAARLYGSSWYLDIILSLSKHE